MRKVSAPLEIIQKKIAVNVFYSGTIRDGYNCARINLPKTLIGKKCYVIILQDTPGEVL